MIRPARMIRSAALCALALNALPRTAGAEDAAPPPVSQPQPQAQPTYIPQGERVFPDGKTMLYDQSGGRGNVTPDPPPTAAPDAPAKDSTKKDSTNPETTVNNSPGGGSGGSSVVKHWQRPPAAPEVIAAWFEKCHPVAYEDSEHIQRFRFAATDCDLTDPRQ
jgi:hypothetical protein